ncbi:hypothetical protein [Haloferula sp. BvORR071]|uniref:hypothetical protein n=1 Tax=Haloferula sp. BvORR071 TaxID=1396141 RepID=UPI00054D46EC|nr:hypothetical protein [Haloferula sp. BvORR071]
MNYQFPPDRSGPTDGERIAAAIATTRAAIANADKSMSELGDKLANLRRAVSSGQEHINTMEALAAHIVDLRANAIAQLEDLQTRLAEHQRQHSSRN